MIREKQMTDIQAVIFDIGNVLLGWQPARFYDSVIGPERRTALFAEVDLHAMNLRVDRGASLQGSVAELRAAHPAWAKEIQIWHDRWSEMLAPVLTESVDLLRALRRTGMPVCALSNFGADTFERARSEHPFLDEFDRHFISGQLGVLKPEPRIYEIVESDLPCAPEALFFTDDSAANIAMAAQRGWQTHLFTGASGLKDALSRHGVKV
jgi:2-haloacid dehalogenase